MSTIIDCPACSKKISSAAPSCIQCGHPMQSQPLHADRVYTTQSTAPVWKVIQFLGVMLIIIGVVACTAGANSGAPILLVLGLALYTIGRFGAWWKHG